MRPHLMRSKRFAPLFWTQFLSAFNDNYLRYTLIFLILVRLSEAEAGSLVTLAGAIFHASLPVSLRAWGRVGGQV